MVMQRDALDGLVRKATGRPLDEAWREGVRAAIGDGRAALATARKCSVVRYRAGQAADRLRGSGLLPYHPAIWMREKA